MRASRSAFSSAPGARGRAELARLASLPAKRRAQGPLSALHWAGSAAKPRYSGAPAQRCRPVRPGVACELQAVTVCTWRPAGLITTSVATSPQMAAKDSHRPGIALLPVAWISPVAMAGVKPPKMAVAKL